MMALHKAHVNWECVWSEAGWVWILHALAHLLCVFERSVDGGLIRCLFLYKYIHIKNCTYLLWTASLVDGGEEKYQACPRWSTHCSQRIQLRRRLLKLPSNALMVADWSPPTSDRAARKPNSFVSLKFWVDYYISVEIIAAVHFTIFAWIMRAIVLVCEFNCVLSFLSYLVRSSVRWPKAPNQQCPSVTVDSSDETAHQASASEHAKRRISRNWSDESHAHTLRGRAFQDILTCQTCIVLTLKNGKYWAVVYCG